MAPPPTAEGAPDVIAVALDMARRLERLGIRYLVSGSLASSVHGEPRSTMDVDLVADLHEAHVPTLTRALASQYYLDPDIIRTAIREARSFNVVHLAAAIKVDVFVAGEDPFEAERLRHRLAVPLGPDANDVLWMDTAEHTLLRKLEWYRRAGEVSDRQWRDIASIIAVQADRLDRDRLQRWAAVLGVEDLLVRALGTD